MKKLISYPEAIHITLESIQPLKSEMVPLWDSEDRVVAMDLHSKVDSPSVDSSLKDGYAIVSEDIDHATPNNPVRLEIIGSAVAGVSCDKVVTNGTAVRILTGAKIPGGATAVVSEEFTSASQSIVTVAHFSEPGRNIMARGSDVALNEQMCKRGDRLTPGKVGILAAAGFETIPVYKRPRVALIATGDEVVVPGRPLTEGKLYASNLVTLNAWCHRYSMQTSWDTVSDKPDKILETLKSAIETHDAIVTSGGAWKGDRDFVATMLDRLGWQQHFHRIRIGPGKAVGFGKLEGKPIFILPGGPPSNLLAFLQVALPGLMKLGGYRATKLPETKVELSESVSVRDIDWTQFIFGQFSNGNEHTRFKPLTLKSRLQSMSLAEGVIQVPEGIAEIPAGTIISAQLLI